MVMIMMILCLIMMTMMLMVDDIYDNHTDESRTIDNNEEKITVLLNDINKYP